jgi:aspartyl-tRNA(Asn)/glutamyl-tRNA(Gln) amidotransferase subunit C
MGFPACRAESSSNDVETAAIEPVGHGYAGCRITLERNVNARFTLLVPGLTRTFSLRFPVTSSLGFVLGLLIIPVSRAGRTCWPEALQAYARIFNLKLILDTAMKISREDVLKVAALANLELTDAEVETYRGQLDDILTYIDKLNEVDTSNVEPMAQVVAGPADDSDLREDVVVRSDVITEVLSGAPDPEAPYFRVPRVIEK